MKKEFDPKHHNVTLVALVRFQFVLQFDKEAIA